MIVERTQENNPSFCEGRSIAQIMNDKHHAYELMRYKEVSKKTRLSVSTIQKKVVELLELEYR